MFYRNASNYHLIDVVTLTDTRPYGVYNQINWPRVFKSATYRIAIKW